MVKCEACCSKGPAWPGYLDFYNLMPYQGCCAWCNGTKEVTPEVAAVYYRLKTQPGLLSVRVTTLVSRATEAKKAWAEARKKKRPKGHSEIDWAAMLERTEQAAKMAHANALDAIWEERKAKEDVGR